MRKENAGLLAAILILQSTHPTFSQGILDRLRPPPPPPPPSSPGNPIPNGGQINPGNLIPNGGQINPGNLIPNGGQINPGNLIPNSGQINPGNLVPNGGQIPGAIQLPAGSACVQLPPLPSAEEIAKLVKVPTEDIAKKVIELQKAPFDALGKAVADKLTDAANKKADALRDWLWEKAAPFLWFIAVFTALLSSMIIGLPIKALLHRVPVKRREQ